MSHDLPPWRRDTLIERGHRLQEAPRTEQLDLFTDNRRTIWLNQAHAALRCLDLAGARVQYDRIVAARLDDREIQGELELVAAWQELLDRYEASDRHSGQIHRLYDHLDVTLPYTLRIALLEFMVDELSGLELPELVFLPPQFHGGLLLYQLGEYADAREWFSRAVEGGILPKGRFLAYQGDALFRLEELDGARELYRQAFLEDPLTVDLPHLADPALPELIASAESELDEPDEIIPWLPVWGWLRNLFTLELHELQMDRTGFRESLDRDEAAERLTTPQLWFQYLRYAELLRALAGEREELVRVRRRMKELNGELFGQYIKKIGG
jgi:tetratricopeptide (TPR) repeat protein